jgi:hypothetical protein
MGVAMPGTNGFAGYSRQIARGTENQQNSCGDQASTKDQERIGLGSSPRRASYLTAD